MNKRILKELSISWNREQVYFEYELANFMSKEKQDLLIKKLRETKRKNNNTLNSLLLKFNW